MNAAREVWPQKMRRAASLGAATATAAAKEKIGGNQSTQYDIHTCVQLA
jgi:hypothetical protein